MSQAEAAVRALDQGRYPVKQIAIVTQNIETEKEMCGFINVGNGAKGSAGAGAWFGGIFGLLMGGAFLLVPGFGPVIVAGSLAAALLGALTGWRVSQEHILSTKDHVKSGQSLLIAHGSAVEAAWVRSICKRGRSPNCATTPQRRPVLSLPRGH